MQATPRKVPQHENRNKIRRAPQARACGQSFSSSSFPSFISILSSIILASRSLGSRAPGVPAPGLQESRMQSSSRATTPAPKAPTGRHRLPDTQTAGPRLPRNRLPQAPPGCHSLPHVAGHPGSRARTPVPQVASARRRWPQVARQPGCRDSTMLEIDEYPFETYENLKESVNDNGNELEIHDSLSKYRGNQQISTRIHGNQ